MVRPAEEAKLKKEMEEVDNDVWVIFDEVQGEAVLQAVEQEKNIITIEGPPGSGKTLIGKEILRRLAEKVREETDMEPIVILTGQYTKEDHPLGELLISIAKEMGGGFVEWNKLLELNGVERIELLGRDGYFNIPEEIRALGEILMATSGGKRTFLMFDKVFSSSALLDQDLASYNWTAMENVSPNINVILTVSSGYDNKHSMILPPSSLHLFLNSAYRSTQCISNLYNCFATAARTKTSSGIPCSEVVGERPKLIVLGKIGLGEDMEEDVAKIWHGINQMRSQVGNEKVSIIVDLDKFSEEIKVAVKDIEKWGWTVNTVNESFGAEYDRVIVIGECDLDFVPRARLWLGIILCCEGETSRRPHLIPLFRAAIDQGVVLVSTPAWHPEVT